MDLDDVTRELELQKMILNGENISEIVQRVRKTFFYHFFFLVLLCFVIFICEGKVCRKGREQKKMIKIYKLLSNKSDSNLYHLNSTNM